MDRDGWIVQEDQIYESFKIFSLRKSLRTNPRSGVTVPFVLMNGMNWVNIIAFTPDQQVLLVRQYRHGAEEMTIEIPGGCIEQHETPQQAAARELREETGWEAAELHELGWAYANPAMQSMKQYCYLGLDTRKVSDSSLEEGEDIKTLSWPLEKVLAGIKDGTINHALVVMAFGLLALKRPEALAAVR